MVLRVAPILLVFLIGATLPAAAAQDCARCHEKEIMALARTVHRGARPASGFGASNPAVPALCESCHGSIGSHGQGEAEGTDAPVGYRKKSAQERSSACLGCHQGSLTQHWPGSVHDARSVSCSDCHRIHPPGLPAAGLPARATEEQTCLSCHHTVSESRWRSSRHPVREGRFLCSSCHEPHGTMADAQLRRTTVNETCLECHADKRGPFLWIHPPVAENCLNCHTAHGSLHGSLLIMKPPRLCQTCHNEPLHVSLPHNSLAKTFQPNRFVFNRGCDNCHQVHGSNSPSGPTLLR